MENPDSLKMPSFDEIPPTAEVLKLVPGTPRTLELVCESFNLNNMRLLLLRMPVLLVELTFEQQMHGSFASARVALP